MEKISIKDMRSAVSYVYKTGVNVDHFYRMTDEDFLKLRLNKDLKMGNIRVLNVVIELERIHNLGLPVELYQQVQDDTVGALFNTIKGYLATQN